MASHDYGFKSRTLDKRITISGEISASPLIKRAIVDGETLRYLANCRTLIFNSSSHKFLMTYPDVRIMHSHFLIIMNFIAIYLKYFYHKGNSNVLD